MLSFWEYKSMKMAIIGSGPLAILTASHFDQMGADVTLFQRSPLGGNLRFLLDHFPDFKINYKKSILTISEFFENEIVPAVTELEKYGLTKSGDVQRVHKRFLHPDESVTGRSRLHDLFRVVYSMNPKETILKQLEENPELFKQLGEEVVNSLHKPVESFLDFDLVVEATGLGKMPAPMGAGKSLALNENNLRESSLLFYQKDIFTKLDLKDKKSIVIAGSGVSLKLSLLKLKEWLLSHPAHELHWVTHQKAESICGIHWLDEEVSAFQKEINDRFEKNKEHFETKLREWRDLEDYVKVKVPKPVEPVPQLMVYEGYDVTSVDRLLDRAGVFATIESPDFRNFAKISGDMQTLSADAICIANGVMDDTLGGTSLIEEEPGYYVMRSTDINSALSEIKLIEESILNYFKKA